MPSRPQFPRDYKAQPDNRRRPPAASRRRAGAVFRGSLKGGRRDMGKSSPILQGIATKYLVRARALLAKSSARNLGSASSAHPQAQVQGRSKSMANNLQRWLANLPGPRRLWLAVGTILVILPVLSLGLEAIGNRSAAVAADLRLTRSLALPDPTEKIPAIVPKASWNVQKVGKGDTLAAVFKRLGLGPGTVHKVVHLDDNTARLTRIYPGDELAFQLAEDGGLKALEYQLSEDERLRVVSVDGILHSEIQATALLTQLRHTGGQINDSLFLAGREAGLSDRLIMDMAGLFGWDIDFVLDIRRGDEFHLIYEEIYRDGEFLRAGEIVAATFINQGDRFQAVRFVTDNGTEYFSPDGRNMRKAFLRAPLNFSYISSNFNPKRFHPIQKRVKAHNGTDYRAPSGTPVFSAGHGKVVESAYNRFNGHYVFVQHGNNIVTKYLHFTKRNVKKGQRVKQGQVIGYVGSTGQSEAPHLHYEFLVNGVHRNPRTVDLPKADPLPKAQLAAFQQVSSPLLNQLDLIQGKALLAKGP